MKPLRSFAAVCLLGASASLLAQTATPPAKKSSGFPLFSGSTTKADDRPQGVNSPVPAALLNGHTVFLSNAGADAGLFPHPFTGTQDRGYAYVYKALSGSGRFQLVGSPAKADLVIEIQLIAPMGPMGDNKSNGTTDPLPEFKLVVYDRPTHYVLWTISQTVDSASRQKTHDQNFDEALDSLVNQLMLVAGKG